MLKTIRRSVAFWLSIRLSLRLAALGAFVAYLTVTLWLRRYTEWFPGAKAIGELVVGVSLSIIAAFIFYVIDVHVKEVRARSRVNAYIGPILKEIMLEGIGFIHSLDRSPDLNSLMASHYKVTDIIKALRRYGRTHENANTLLKHNYTERMKSIQASIKKILVHYPNLEPELIDILNGMLQSYMFQRIEWYDEGEELTSMADPILEFMYRLRDLHSYTSAHIPNYHQKPDHPDFVMYELYLQNRGELRSLRRKDQKSSMSR